MSFRPLHLILLAIAALATILPALIVAYGPVVRPTPARRTASSPRRIVPPAEVPPVEPMAYVQLPPDEARAFNATVPFVEGPIVPARPFRFTGAVENRARAVDCLAAAAVYEAGDDTGGEQAVAQVILNRLRHPAYPKTVCGVVFEGSERRTGCQFTFTCDGAITRHPPSPDAWARAEAVAAAALNGAVDRRVGWATHYHTNYVVPYWQSSLDKIAAVGTHLFFRWTGYWGTPGAFRNPGARSEPAVAALATLSDVHRVGAGVTDDELATTIGSLGPDPLVVDDVRAPSPVPGEPDNFLVTLPRGAPPALYPALAAAACADRPRCKYLGWADPAKTPYLLPLQADEIAAMSFTYLRDRAAGLERTLWNCAQTPRPDKHQCMKTQPPAPVAAPSPTPTPGPATPSKGPTAPPKGPTELDGVRRKPPAPAPTPKPADPATL